MASRPPIIAESRSQGQLLEVHMDDLQILHPGADDSDRVIIGTEGLNGCTCVVILGKAILMAHISPFPGSVAAYADGKHDVQADSTRHHESFMQRIQARVQENPTQFPPDCTTSWGIFCGGPDGLVRLTTEIVMQGLAALGFASTACAYPEVAPEEHVAPRGEVVASLRTGSPELWLEGIKIFPMKPRL